MALYEGYLDCITSEHRDKPKYAEMMKLLLGYTDDPMQISFDMPDAFNINTAAGTQLDTIGLYLGRSRVMLFNAKNGASSILSDELYRILLNATIAKMNWDGGIESLQERWRALLPDITISIRDNQDMTIDVSLVGVSDEQLKEMIELGYIIPKPEGVRVNMQISANPLFAYDLDTATFAGYEKGEWSNG
mgnify:FL=1|jgi:hypothetical protein